MMQFMKHYKNNFTVCRLYTQTRGINTQMKDNRQINSIFQ